MIKLLIIIPKSGFRSLNYIPFPHKHDENFFPFSVAFPSPLCSLRCQPPSQVMSFLAFCLYATWRLRCHGFLWTPLPSAGYVRTVNESSSCPVSDYSDPWWELFTWAWYFPSIFSSYSWPEKASTSDTSYPSLFSRCHNFPAIFLEFSIVHSEPVCLSFHHLKSFAISPAGFFALDALPIIATGSFSEFFPPSFWALEVGVTYLYWEMICGRLLKIAFSTSFERTHS